MAWAIGEHISGKVARERWGLGTVKRLADWLASRDAGLRGFSASNLCPRQALRTGGRVRKPVQVLRHGR